MIKPPQKIVKHLSFDTVGSAHISNNYGTTLTILAAADTDEGRHVPAESACVHGIDGIRALAELCNETIKAYDEANPAPKSTDP